MKFVHALLALCVLLPDAATAKTLVVSVRGNTSYVESRSHELRRVRAILDATGADYKVIQSNAPSARTEFIRKGAVTWNFGSPGAYAEQFDAVILVGFGDLTSGASRWDSLLKHNVANSLPNTVPILVMGDMSQEMDGAVSSRWSDGDAAGTCTTGVSNADDLPLTVTQSRAFYQVGYPERMLTSSNLGAWVRNPTPPAGGLRVHLARTESNLSIRTLAQGVPCANCDSLVQSDTPDSLVLWERPMSHLSGAKPIIFSWGLGSGLCADDSGSAGFNPCEGEQPILLAGLARLDSLSGGRVFGPKPIRWALTIDGGFSRSQRRNPGGVSPGDTASLKATIDSLQALDIPAVLGVNLDSVASYPSEKGWWTRWRRLRFSPQSRYGLDSTVLGANANWNRLKPVDVWGRWRSRVAYHGNDCSNAGDSSVFCGLKSQFFRMDSIPDFAGRTSRFIMAPDDDWTPVNKLGAKGADSVLWAAIQAGVTGIRVNSQEEPLGAYGPGRTTNPKGWYGRQGWRTPLAGEHHAVVAGTPASYARSAPNSDRIKLLAHSGYSIMGSHSQIDVRSDSTAPYVPDAMTYGWAPIPNYELQRAWNAGIFDKYIDEDYMTPWQTSTGSSAVGAGADGPWGNVNKPKVDMIVGIQHGNIIRMSAQEFAGNPTIPTRPGYWTIKSMAHAMRVINRMANRNVVMFSYPEEIEP